MHHSASGITTDLGSIPGCVITGRDRESHRAEHNLPPSSGFGEGLAGGLELGSSRSSTSLWRAGHLQADLGHQLNSVSSDPLVRLASGLSGQAGVKKHGLAGTVLEDA